MRKNSFKIISISLFLLAAVFVLSGCGAPQLAKPKPDPSSTAKTYDITGECSISINGDVIIVSGKTNFDAGTMLNISVIGQNGMTLDNVTIPQQNPNEKISHDFAINDKYEGITKVIGYITCAPTQYGKHPEGIYEKYGKKFEYINAAENYIWNNDGVVVLFVSDMVKVHR